MPEFERAARVSVYLSMPSGEISTGEIVRQAIAKGKRVFVPSVQCCNGAQVQGKVMDMLALHSIQDLEGLQRDAWGIPTLDSSTLCSRENALGGLSPSNEASAEEKANFKGLDLILMPGVAFDSSNGRLGHGKGFYDQFLQRYWQQASGINSNAEMPQLGMFFSEPIFPNY